MKNHFVFRATFFIIFFHLTSYCIAQTGDWLWVKGEGGILNDVCNSITTDAAGNVYTTGYYESDTMHFGNVGLPNDSSPSADIFISKYDGSGNLLWAKRAGGTRFDIATAIGSDANGNIYLTGAFSSALINFGSITLNNTVTGSFDIFIAKFDSSGNALWAKSTGGSNDDLANNIFVDGNSNLYVTGYFYSDSIVFGNTMLSNAGGNSDDIFTVKLDSSGNMIWAKRAGGTNEDVGYGICADQNFNVYVTGHFLSYTISFDATILTNTSMNSDDIFIVKYDSSGNMIWVKNTGGFNDDVGNGICTDVLGNIYLTGAFFSTSIAFDAITLNNLGGADVFVVKYDSAGHALWAKNAGGTDNDVSLNITSDTGSNVYLTGYFKSQSFTFGSYLLSNLSVVSDDIFVSKLDSTGNILWAISAGGNVDDWGLSIHCDVNSNIYVAGAYVSSSINFGNTNLVNTHYNNANADIWLGKLDRATGILAENSFPDVFHLFPNPFTAQTTIAFSNPVHNATFFFYNFLGEKVAEVSGINGESFQFNRGNLQSGVYVFEVMEKGKSIGRGKAIIY